MGIVHLVRFQKAVRICALNFLWALGVMISPGAQAGLVHVGHYWTYTFDQPLYTDAGSSGFLGVDMNNDGTNEFSIYADREEWGGQSALHPTGLWALITGPLEHGSLIGPNGVLPANGPTTILTMDGFGNTTGTPGAYTYGISFNAWRLDHTLQTLYGWVTINTGFADTTISPPGAWIEVLAYGFLDNGKTVLAGATPEEQQSYAQSVAQSVPEPESVYLLLAAVAMLVVSYRRKSNRGQTSMALC